MGRKRASRTSLVRGSIAGSRNGAAFGESLALPKPRIGSSSATQRRVAGTPTNPAKGSGIMRRVLHAGLVLLILSVLSVATIPLPPLSAAPRNPAPRGPLAKPANLAAYVSDEILVAFRPGIRPDTAAQAGGARGHSQIEGLGVHILKVPQGTVEGTLRALEHNPLVEFAEPNGFVYAFENPNDPYANGTCYWDSSGQCTTQWAWAKVQGPQAWDLTTGSATVRVAVVDTGIDAGGPPGLPPDPPPEDLGAGSRCNSPTTPVILKSYVSGERGNDDNGHGTHIAGVIGACTNNTWAVAGANWRSEE